ncbi:MAG: 23S rRNA (uridine(2552)-2'-O)-methyltransferase RlmE [Methylotenera sp.]|jgi:23S rRNA (uridine2552-2'-O)-methyltransferase|uniref:23S rRNA (uridine(2552)-2'-O)-methyltransferase RlmE n=1 Tax=Methylotenera sp. TaxID=2051956 RepID=UPI0027267015|nr:23S rRNA (uridine(2552)-2'-O)-methyltransferase RlmE [Methylotenera sp.]MDO9150135.1 23S rRNA (uridine(2552)-2'-O)-methyltransferase RlmE [Methylotenera sp.]
MKPTRTSKAWMQEHLNDPYVKLAQKDGYRARAAYKLMEIDDKDKLIRPGMTIVDLGSAPGSWSQVVVQRLKGQGKVIALDILDMSPIGGVTFLQGDFREESVLRLLEQTLNNVKVDLVIADMAPNISGVKDVDQAGAAYLTELALDFSQEWLKPSGNFLVKVFIGAGFEEILQNMRQMFDKVVTRKPKASRDRSSEVYLLGIGRKP